MQRKKICYIVVIDRVIKFFFYPHINAMLEEGNDVTVVAPLSDKEALYSINGKVSQVHAEICRTVNPINLIKNIVFFIKLFRKEQFDIIQYTGPSTSLICSLAGKLGHVPIRQYCMWGIRYEGFDIGIKRSIFKFFEKITCKFSTNVIFDSEYNRRFAIDEGLITEEKSSVIGSGSACGVDLSVYNFENKQNYRLKIREQYGIKDNDFVFGYVGRLSKEKGTDEFLKAAKKITEQYDDVKLLIVGFHEGESDIDEQLLRWADDSSQVIFCGRIDNPAEHYAAFDAFVFPSHREGFGGGCIQAGAFAVPSIVSDIRPLMDAIQNGEYGEFFKLGNWEDLYDKMQLFYLNRDLSNKYGEKLFMRVKNCFEMEKWKSLYKEHMNKQVRNLYERHQ